VSNVLAPFAVEVEDLPAYRPHLKGSVETVDGAHGRVHAVAGRVIDENVIDAILHGR
jgi:hypothetical protein